MQPVYQTPSQAHDEPASSRSQGGDVEISDAVDDKKHLDTEKHDLKTQVAKVKTKVAEVKAKVAEVEGKMKLIVNFVKGHATVSDLNKGVESLRGWDESDRTAGKPGEPSDRLVSIHESLEEEKKSLNQQLVAFQNQLVAFQNQLVEFQKRLTLLAQAPPETADVEQLRQEVSELRVQFGRNNPAASSSSRVKTRTVVQRELAQAGKWERQSTDSAWLKPSSLKEWKPHVEKKLRNVFVADASSEASLQMRLAAVLCGKKHRTTEWHDTSKSDVFQSHEKPDFTCAPLKFSPSEYTALAFIDVKNSTTNIANSDCMGQVASYMTAALDGQGALLVVYAVVANNTKAVAVKCSRDEDGELHFYETPMYQDPAAVVRVLCDFADQDSVPTLLHDSSTLRFGKSLGRGAHCEAFTVVRKGDDATKKFDAVGKQFTDKMYFDREMEALKKLADSGFEYVPRLKAHDETGLRLVTSPRGRHFTVDRLLTMKHVKQLMAVLKKLHELGFVHCDVRPSNFFASEEGGVVNGGAFLNDWSSSSIVGTDPILVLPKGFRIPGRKSEGPASQVDDLYSFALSCFMVQNATKVTGDFLLSDKLPPIWHKLLENIAAGEMKHDELLAGLEELVPRAPSS
ncbi:hypothetical protein DIPPA_23714 [Diplonema papillatum]|nr:hypothetical protein DIPPA_23714 [Diplonema papillatum]